MGSADLLERERDGPGYIYKLSEKGRNLLQQIKKREREQREQDEDIFDYEDGVEEFVRYFEDEDFGYSEVEKRLVRSLRDTTRIRTSTCIVLWSFDQSVFSVV